MLTSAEAQTHDRLIQLLDDFGGLTASTPSMSVDIAVQCLNELAAARVVSGRASGDALVTISSRASDGPDRSIRRHLVCGLHADEGAGLASAARSVSAAAGADRYRSAGRQCCWSARPRKRVR